MGNFPIGEVLPFAVWVIAIKHYFSRFRCVENLHSTLSSVMEVIGVAALEKHHPLINAFIDTLALKSYPVFNFVKSE